MPGPLQPYASDGGYSLVPTAPPPPPESGDQDDLPPESGAAAGALAAAAVAAAAATTSATAATAATTAAAAASSAAASASAAAVTVKTQIVQLGAERQRFEIERRSHTGCCAYLKRFFCGRLLPQPQESCLMKAVKIVGTGAVLGFANGLLCATVGVVSDQVRYASDLGAQLNQYAQVSSGDRNPENVSASPTLSYDALFAGMASGFVSGFVGGAILAAVSASGCCGSNTAKEDGIESQPDQSDLKVRGSDLP